MALLEETWRWYGPKDPVSLSDVKQSGATGIVTALHDIPIGQVWGEEAILAMKTQIEANGLRWSVVESIPVHDCIKRGAPERDEYITNYCTSIRNLGKCGINRVCYNFMPVIDWSRTDLARKWPDGSHALAFDMIDLAAFDLHILQRPGAAADYSVKLRSQASARFESMSTDQRTTLFKTVTAGLPGTMVAATDSVEAFQAALDAYKGINADALRENLAYFLRGVVPAAEAAGVFLAIHPDDPPMPLLGLPRVVSTNEDIEFILKAVDKLNNGLTFCVGSYASSAGNDVEAMAEAHAARTHFVHLRNVRREGGGNGSFVESDHLDGEVDMFRVMRTFVLERQRRCKEGWADDGIPFRPDHGHQMLDDLREGKKTNPGYTAIGRLRGLAELRGLQRAITRVESELQSAHGEGAKRLRAA